jgi:hypothetical protein
MTALPYLTPAELADATGDYAAAGLSGPGQRAPNERELQLIALRLASPKRANAGRTIEAQADAGHLPLFIAADESRLF